MTIIKLGGGLVGKVRQVIQRVTRFIGVVEGERFPSLDGIYESGKWRLSEGRKPGRGLLVGNDGRRSFIGLSAPLDKEENFATPPPPSSLGRVSWEIDHRRRPPPSSRYFSRERGRNTWILRLLPTDWGAIEREILAEVHARFMHILTSATAAHSTAETVRGACRKPWGESGGSQ